MENANMTMPLRTNWRYQTTDGLATHEGAPTDSRGLKLRAESGYGWVNMNTGWLQLSVAIRKLELAERFAAAARTFVGNEE